jgi:predicted HicB family RNase H-like nuclease
MVREGEQMERQKLYRYVVGWEEEDQVFVARVTEFPSLSAHGDTHEQALSELQHVVAVVLEDLEQEGSPLPEPLSMRRYSGRFQLRIPPELHRRLATEAQEQGVSLNQVALLKLSAHLSSER